MNRADIVESVTKHSDTFALSQKLVREALDFVIESMSDALLNGEPVKLSGFGTFETRNRLARTGRNPKTGEPVEIKAHKTIVFRPTKNFWTKST